MHRSPPASCQNSGRDRTPRQQLPNRIEIGGQMSGSSGLEPPHKAARRPYVMGLLVSLPILLPLLATALTSPTITPPVRSRARSELGLRDLLFISIRSCSMIPKLFLLQLVSVRNNRETQCRLFSRLPKSTGKGETRERGSKPRFIHILHHFEYQCTYPGIL